MKTILIADDSKVFRSLEEAFLAQRGYRCLHAEDGAAALKLAIEAKPDLILLDVQMPVMDGVQTLAALKSNEATRAIPVIIITTLGRDEDRSILRKGGADDVISKPINGHTLVRKVGELIGH